MVQRVRVSLTMILAFLLYSLLLQAESYEVLIAKSRLS